MKAELNDIKDWVVNFTNSAAFTALAGSLTSALFSGEKLSFWKRIAYIAVGTVTCMYIAPIVIDFFGIEKQSVKNGFVFILGVMGVWIISSLINFGKALKKNPSKAIQDLVKNTKSLLSLKNMFGYGDSPNTDSDKNDSDEDGDSE